MKEFYTDIIGLEETSNPDLPFLTYKSESITISIFQAKNRIQPVEGWVALPGHEGGSLETFAWSIQIPAPFFSEVVRNIKQAQIETLENAPVWCEDSFWAFSVKDPMGNTVELFSVPTEKPASPNFQI